MITYYYKQSRASDLTVLDEYRPGCWIHVEAPTPDEMTMLVQKFHLNASRMDDVLDQDEIPRLEREEETTYMFVRYAHVSDDTAISTTPLLCVINETVFMTMCAQPFLRLQEFTAGRVDFSTTHHTLLVLQVVDQIVDQYETSINTISRQIQVIRTRLRTHQVGNQDFVDFVEIEDELNEFLVALQPTTAILRRLMLGRHVTFSQAEHSRIQDLLLNVEQSIEGCRSNVKTIVSIREAYATIASNNLSRTMKVLTMATLLLALPNVFFGMYGMNIALPFQHEIWAYVFVLFLTLLATTAVIFYARSRRIL